MPKKAKRGFGIMFASKGNQALNDKKKKGDADFKPNKKKRKK